jgi:GT2 family glycosyltransferase
MITVIIVTKDRPRSLALTTKSVMDQTLLPDQIITVDDSRNYPYPKTSGIPAARNKGLKSAPPGIILFIDDDVTLDKDYIKTISRYFKDHPEVDGVTGWIDTAYHRESPIKRLVRACIGSILPRLIPASLFIPTVSEESALYPVFQKPYVDSVPAEWLSGCNMAYRSSVFDEGYRFDESLKGYALGEDREFSNRLYRDGKQLRLVYGARLIHRGSL